MNFNEKAENQISTYCNGLREVLMNLAAIGDNDCTSRQWNEKEAILQRLRLALKTLENPSTCVPAPVAAADDDDGFAEFIDALTRLHQPPAIRLVQSWAG